MDGTNEMSEMNTPSGAGQLWEWRPLLTEETRRKTRLVIGAGIVGVVAVVAGAVIAQSRIALILAVLVISIGVFWFAEHRRLMSTACRVGPDGLLTISDSRSTTSVQLATADRIEVRHRASGSGGLSASGRWSIEIAGTSGVAQHVLANVAGAFNLPEAQVREVESELRRCAEGFGAPLASAGRPSPAAPDSEIAAARPDAFAPPAATPRSAGQLERFEWHPRLSPNAGRNRWLLRASFGVPALAIATYAVFAYRDEGIVTVLLSAATVPGMLLAIGAGLDWAARRGRSFQVVADAGVMHIGQPGKERALPLVGGTVSIELVNQAVQTGTGGATHTTRWQLHHTAPDGDERRVSFPSFGTATTREDYIALERELQRRT